MLLRGQVSETIGGSVDVVPDELKEKWLVIEVDLVVMAEVFWQINCRLAVVPECSCYEVRRILAYLKPKAVELCLIFTMPFPNSQAEFRPGVVGR